MSEAFLSRSPALERVERGKLCAGCGLCAGIAPNEIEMIVETPGYARPRQIAPVSRTIDRTVAETCPGLTVYGWDRMREADHSHESWGPYIDCLTGHARDPDVRHAGSSGGMISALAIHALECGLAAQVLHIEGDSEFPTGNRMVLSHTPAEVLERAGSRYAPSSPLVEIERMLSEGTPTVFIGKPCDVSALRSLALLDDRVDRTFPLKLSFFCGGIPSHAGAQRIIEAMGLDPVEVEDFRYRGNGWPGLTVARERSGKTGEMSYEQSWGRYLSSQVQFRCKICPDPVGGVADIACADAWYGGESGYPQFDEADGRSLVMVRSEAGRAFLDAALTAGKVEITPLPIAEVDLMQPAQARRKRRIAARMAAWRVALRPVPEMNGLLVGKATRKERPHLLLKEFLGTLRRVLQGRI